MRVASGHYRSGVEVLMTVVPSVEKGAAPEGLSAADCGSRTRVADASKIRYVLQKTNPQLPDLASQFADIRSLVDSGDSTVGKPVTMLVSRLFSKHATPVSPTGDGRVDLDLGQADTTEADEVGIPDTTQTRVGCITNERIWSIENGELCIRFPYEGRDLTGADISAILAAKGIAGTNFQAAAVVEAPSQHVALKEDLNRRRGSGSVSSGEPAEARIVALLDAAYWWKGKLKQIMSLRFPNADVISKAAG
ncbi:MAG: uncharacterized protein KVP18_001819 [Porospora cf. gigantea A]|uniref:uncharacterized protein n=1 Tax=Porospora cf. gigantea A TaxID=2853593 RepID=UPI00355A0C45|nr:MAG: hypothetical protein KVP18_001819 [Porospora cf. gigantea A]